MGHASASISWDLYAHSQKRLVNAAGKKISAMYNEEDDEKEVKEE